MYRYTREFETLEEAMDVYCQEIECEDCPFWDFDTCTIYEHDELLNPKSAEEMLRNAIGWKKVEDE